jgi:hypothetical protein
MRRGHVLRLQTRKRLSPVSTAAHAQAGRDRVRQSRLKAARERRLRLDPDQVAREKRIDAATVDVELAWEARAVAQRAVESAEVAAAAAVERLLDERLTVGDVVQLTGLDQSTVRRLRKAKVSIEAAPPCPSPQEQRTEG